MQELLQASGYAALVYLLFNYLVSFGSGRPLVEWINPGRRYLPLLAIGLLGVAYSLLLRGVWRYQAGHLDLLQQLVNEEPLGSWISLRGRACVAEAVPAFRRPPSGAR